MMQDRGRQALCWSANLATLSGLSHPQAGMPAKVIPEQVSGKILCVGKSRRRSRCTFNTVGGVGQELFWRPERIDAFDFCGGG